MTHAVPHNAPSCAGCSASDVTRRQFVSAATLAAVAVVLDACTSVTSPGSNGNSGGPITVKLTDFSALSAVGGIARVDSGGTPTAVVRTGTSTFAAYSLVCPHQGTTVSITSGSFTCPNHGARFNASGTWTGGQGTGNLQSYTATLDAAAGTVTVARPK